jgi:hypothetical protein
MKDVVCKGCSVLFVAKHSNSKYHSTECRDKHYESNYPTTKYTSYRKSAEKRGFSFLISFDYFMTYWNKPCSYCGSDIKSVGIDRIDSNKGYEEGNTTSCCNTCNTMKTVMTKEHFLSHCKKISMFNSNEKQQ